MPKLLECIVTVTEVFYQYATQDEECDALNKAELKELLQNEFQHILKVRTPCPDWRQVHSSPLSTFCHVCQTPSGLSPRGHREQGLVKA